MEWDIRERTKKPGEPEGPLIEVTTEVPTQGNQYMQSKEILHQNPFANSIDNQDYHNKDLLAATAERLKNEQILKKIQDQYDDYTFLHKLDRKLIEEIKTPSGPDLAAHHENFISCIRAGGKPNADITINHLSTALCHLGNIAARTRRALIFDPVNEQFIGDADASKLLRREYREHWATPGT